MKKFLDLLVGSRNIVILFLVLLGILLIGLGNLPQWKEKKSLQKEKEALETLIEEQQLLMPPHLALLHENQTIFPEGTPTVSQEQTNPENISVLIVRIEDTANTAGVELVSVTPYPESFTTSGRSFRIGCAVRGTYPNIQKFLINLGAMPTLEYVEEMVTGADPNGIHCRLQLRFEVNG